MKYLFIILFSVASSLAHASYHEGEGSTGSGDSGGYGSGGSTAAALLGVGLVAYFVINRNSDDSESEFSNDEDRKKFEIDFLQDKSKFSGFSEDFASQNKFPVCVMSVICRFYFITVKKNPQKCKADVGYNAYTFE